LRAVLPVESGGSATPRVGELPDPVAGPGEILLRTRAAGLNHVDLLQLRGLYPPPSGESEIPGLEAAGEVVGLGEGVSGWREGERAAALLAGGGQAELVAVPAGQAIPVPEGWSHEEAAGLPEVAVTAWTNLVVEGRLAAGESVLIAGATSGVGSYAVELAMALGAGRVTAVGRDPERLARLEGLGADELVTFEELAGAPRPADLVVDLVGGEHLPTLLRSLVPRGRHVLVGLMAGRSATVDLGLVLRNRLELRGSVLRSRSRAEKAELVGGFAAFAGERLARRELVPLVDRVFPFGDVAAAYDHLARGRPLGKVVVRTG